MFDKHPKIRIIYIIGYLGSLVFFYNMEMGIIWKIIISLIMLFGSYLSLVEAQIIMDKNARNINTVVFDMIGIVFIIFTVSSFIKSL